ncbi:MAG: hypothetical protein WAW61_05855 [Methylococcaceae bacterium]
MEQAEVWFKRLHCPGLMELDGIKVTDENCKKVRASYLIKQYKSECYAASTYLKRDNDIAMPSVPTINQQGDAVERYANSLASQLESSSHPACQAIASSIRSFGSSGAPDYVRQRQVDAIFDKAPGICLQY